jgi:hypothetical protein
MKIPPVVGKQWLIVLFLASVPLFLRAAPAQTEIGTQCLVPAGIVPLDGVEGRLDHLAVDVRGQRLFVSGLENHTIEVVDLAKRRRIHEIAGVSEPQGLVFIPERNRLMVCCRGDGTCRSFDANTFVEGPWVDLGRNSDNVRFDAGPKIIYVGTGGEPGNGLLSAIDLASLLPAGQGGQPAEPHSPADFLLDRPRQADPKFGIQLPAHPESFQLDPANRRLYVNVPDEHQIAVLDFTPTNLTVAINWPVTVAEKNFPMALNADSARLYIACRKPPLLASFDTHTGNLLSQTLCVGDADDMFYDAKLKRIYVIGGEGYVDVFQVPATGEELAHLAHVPTALRARTGLFIPDLQTLVVARPHTTNGPAAVLLFRAKP